MCETKGLSPWAAISCVGNLVRSRQHFAMYFPVIRACRVSEQTEPVAYACVNLVHSRANRPIFSVFYSAGARQQSTLFITEIVAENHNNVELRLQFPLGQRNSRPPKKSSKDIEAIVISRLSW